VAGLKDSAAYLEISSGHHPFFLGIVVLAIILWGVCIGWEKDSAQPNLSLNAPAASGSSPGNCQPPLLDFTNSYGVRPFCPSVRAGMRGTSCYFDPLLLILLTLGLGVPWLLRLVSEEVGARKSRLTRGAIFSLCALAAIVGIARLCPPARPEHPR